MNLTNNYQKFKKHMREGGLIYGIWHGIKYFIFLIRRQVERPGATRSSVINKGDISIVYTGSSIKFLWNDFEVTEGVGLSVAINTLGLWISSPEGEWQILEKGKDYFKFKVILRDLPLSQIWIMKIKDEREIDLQIDVQVEEWLHIDEFRIVSFLKPFYKSWFADYQQIDFPRPDNRWHDLHLGSSPVSLVGVRFCLGERSLPSFVMEAQRNNLFACIQNPPSNSNARVIGFRHVDSEENKDYSPGFYKLFNLQISLYEDKSLLDKKIEHLRQKTLKTLIKKETDKGSSKRQLKVLLVNLPWQRNGVWGVRAGSRWPHLKDRSEGNYLPFPFFLAYAASLLQKNNIETTIIDAIAEQLREEVFTEKILSMNFDYLVAETSVPSFFEDMGLLQKISKAGIKIILCGPHAEIYKDEFIRQYPFIDFVLKGEYEYALLELTKALQGGKDTSKIPGLIYKDGEKVINNNIGAPLDINLLPWPLRDTLPMEKYWDLPGNIPYPSAQMLASRGCPFACNFCLWPQVMYQGNHYRTRDIDDLVNEMEYLVKKKNFKSVYFDDDTFNIGKERMLKISQKIKERTLQNIPWAIMARADLMDEEMLVEMRSAGLFAVKYGVESCVPHFVRDCQKDLDLNKTDKMIKLTKDLGIKVHLTFTFGFLGETKKSIQETIDYGLALDPDSVQFSILTPFPGTKLFEDLDKENKILTYDWSRYDGHFNCVFQPDNLRSEDLVEAKRRAYLLWGEHLRARRGLRGEIKRFQSYLREYGFGAAMGKTFEYLDYVWIKKRKYLNGKY